MTISPDSEQRPFRLLDSDRSLRLCRRGQTEEMATRASRFTDCAQGYQHAPGIGIHPTTSVAPALILAGMCLIAAVAVLAQEQRTMLFADDNSPKPASTGQGTGDQKDANTNLRHQTDHGADSAEQLRRVVLPPEHQVIVTQTIRLQAASISEQTSLLALIERQARVHGMQITVIARTREQLASALSAVVSAAGSSAENFLSPEASISADLPEHEVHLHLVWKQLDSETQNLLDDVL